MGNDKKMLALKLRKTYESVGLTQEGLAEKADVPLSTLKEILLQKNMPRATTLFRLARALGVTMDELMDGQPLKPRPREELFRLLNQLDERTIVTILGVVTSLIGDHKTAASGE